MLAFGIEFSSGIFIKWFFGLGTSILLITLIAELSRKLNNLGLKQDRSNETKPQKEVDWSSLRFNEENGARVDREQSSGVDMNIVRRKSDSEIAAHSEPNPLRAHAIRDLEVKSQLMLGPQPSISIWWNVPAWPTDTRLLGFRSTSGFCNELKPRDLSKHGSLILEARKNDRFEEALAEGTYYYTFLLQTPGIFLEGLSEPVRFSETVPTAKIALGRYKDQIELTELAEDMKLRKLERRVRKQEARLQIKRNSAELEKLNAPLSLPPPPVENRSWVQERKLAIKEIVEAAIAAQETEIEIYSDPRYLRLDKETQQEIQRLIKTTFDPSEVSARREQRGH